jgi:hypothetical protein|tara:strand:- start:384 stop:584 length:201 start_codon:yes stop_codon:yes gene_type:complete
MGKFQNSYLIELEDDAWSMDRDEFIQKHGIWNEDFYLKIERRKDEELRLIDVQQSLYRFLNGGKNK